MTIEELKKLMSSGEFHHATMRTDFARGLHIYAKEDNKFNGFKPVGYFSSVYNKEECERAYQITRNTGIYEGSYR
jgi:hypothetical protein